MSLRYQNNPRAKGKFPSYYTNHTVYAGSYAQTDVPGRTSRRIHDGFDLTRNYGLDTTSDDVNSSQYSSPYYINGRFLANNLVSQRGNSSSVQGIKMLLLPTGYYRSSEDDYDNDTVIDLWQGKQIKFEIPYDGKLIGNIIRIKNTGGSSGILSIYISSKENGIPEYETSVDLCTISQDVFERVHLYSIIPIEETANPYKKLYVRMEIWDELDRNNKRSSNPFNPGRKIEIKATSKGSHYECIYELQEKNRPVDEKYEYNHMPNRPAMGLIYSDWESVPCDRLDNIKTGATVSLNKYRYDIFCVKKPGEARVLVYDKEMNTIVGGDDIKVDSRVTQLNIAQVTDTNKITWVYYVDGYSPLQRFKIGEWVSQSPFGVGSADDVTAQILDAETWYNSALGSTSGTYVFTYHNDNWQYNDSDVSLSTYGITLVGGAPSEGSTITVIYTVTEGGTKNIESIEFVDARPVIAASLIMFHNNRLYLSGFRNDPNLVQMSAIDAEGPDFTQFPYRFYAPNRSPYDTSLNPITAMTEVANDQIMISLKNGFTLYQTYGSSKSTGLEDFMPSQVGIFTDSAGVQTQGDIVNYKGIVYSFDQKEGLRRFTGNVWNHVPAAQPVSSHYDRVDMTKPRKMWGSSNKLYFNYTDRVDGKYKCLIWDQSMNYQSYPMFQDVDVPFCDIRFDESEDLVGIHPDYPAIMLHYAEDTWRRFDSPITFERHTKYLNLPGNAADIIIKRVHVKVLANADRWWWVAISGDKQSFYQERGKDIVYREPVWKNDLVEEPAETAFPSQDIHELYSVYRLSIMNLRLERESVQVKVKAKTFRSQSSLLSVLIEVGIKQYL